MPALRLRNLPELFRRVLAGACGVWLALAALYLLTLFLGNRAGQPWLWGGYCGLTLLASFASIALYGIDKDRAVRERRRVPERLLHALEFAGGWPGAAIAQVLFRHKTQKGRYQFIYWLSVALHAALLCAAA